MSLSQTWKQRLAGLMRWPLMKRLMDLGIRLFIPKRPVGVSLVLLDEDGRVLLLRHVFHPYLPWALPGGWLKRHETPQIGVLRELREETGLTAVLGPVLAIDDVPHPNHVGIIFLGIPQPGAITLNGEILEADWFRPDDLPDILPFQQRAIATAVRYHQQTSKQAVSTLA
ncbi:MAG: NUDIX domain-containing protein [Anaerolineales bacterium]|nr:NUDIX domain-containing protein [Anaerolineales bacterium]